MKCANCSGDCFDLDKHRSHYCCICEHGNESYKSNSLNTQLCTLCLELCEEEYKRRKNFPKKT